MVTEAPARMPLKVKIAVVTVWIQAVLNGLGGFFILVEVNDRLDHNQEVDGLMRPLAYASIILALVLFTCAVLARKRYGWVRNTVLVIEAFAVLSGLIGLAASGGAPSFAAGIAFAIAIASGFTGEGGKWFDR
ncbi:hypothetical protein ACFYO0_25660 [Streptomyces sp. NPDC006365]|uniref:hypothetical protein n=1 Tax=Streptomyces sp. NPDC006365 TaxID=3364744 RepID=UPI0036C5105A